MNTLPASSKLDALVSAATAAFAQAPSPADLENAKAQFLGKAGRVTALNFIISVCRVKVV